MAWEAAAAWTSLWWDTEGAAHMSAATGAANLSTLLQPVLHLVVAHHAAPG